MRQLCRDFVAAVAVGSFFAFRDPAMQFSAATNRHPLIQHFFIKRVKKPVTRCHRAIGPVTRGLGSDELPAARKAPATSLDLAKRAFECCSDCRGGKLGAHHACGLEHPLLIPGQPLQVALVIWRMLRGASVLLASSSEPCSSR